MYKIALSSDRSFNVITLRLSFNVKALLVVIYACELPQSKPSGQGSGQPAELIERLGC
jgi:hypothetical protein